jgi:hypothetical protein
MATEQQASTSGSPKGKKVNEFDDVPDMYSTLAGTIFTNVPTLDKKDIASAAAKLAILAEDVNGPNTFSLENAAYGYIEKFQRLVLPANYLTEFTSDGVSSLDVVQLFVVMYYNYLRLRSGGVNESDAFFIAAYRTRLIDLGYLYPNKTSRAVTVDEVDWSETAKDYAGSLEVSNDAYKSCLANDVADEEQLSLFIEHSPDTPFRRFLYYATQEAQANVIKHLTFSAEQYAAMTYLVFRQHGHHYKQEFDQKYNTLWKATTIDSSSKYPGHELVHRVAIHSFGVKCLHEMFFENIKDGKLAETFIDRQDVAPSGTAVVATCWASFELMKSLPIWDDLNSAYMKQIAELEQQAKKLKNAEDAIKYHRNARLFGKNRFTLDVTIAHALAPVAKGFIVSLGTESDLSKQRALDKRANQNPLIVMTVTSVIDKVIRSTRRDADFKALQGGQPKIAQPIEETDDEDEDD